MAFDTVANIVGDAAVELGLVSTKPTDPYASTDPNIIQLLAFLTGLGQDLARDFQWSHLQTPHTFNTAIGTSSYDLPDGYVRTIDSTHWNRTQQRPLLGPVDASRWQQLQATAEAVSADHFFRVAENYFQLYPTPTAVEQIAYEYITNFWVKVDPDEVPSLETPTDKAHVCYFDRRVLIAGVKLAFLRAKRMATQDDLDAYEAALSRATGGDGAAPVLSLNGSGAVARALGPANIPDTGYGS